MSDSKPNGKATLSRKKSYCVKWWDAYGNPQISSPMTQQMADVFAKSMSIDQDATIVLVYQNSLS